MTSAPSTSTFGPHGSQRTHTDEDDGAPRTPMLGAPQDPRFDASVLSRSLTRPPQKRNGQFTDSMSQAESRGRVPKPRPPPPSATRPASPRVPVCRCRFGRPPRGGALMSSHARKPRGARGAPSRRGSCNRVGGSGGGEGRARTTSAARKPLRQSYSDVATVDVLQTSHHVRICQSLCLRDLEAERTPRQRKKEKR